MNRPQFLRHTISALAVTWVVAGASASAQMPLLIDEILMSDYGNRHTTPNGTAVVLDGSGRWSTLRAMPDDHARWNTNMSELLEFDAADTLGAFDSNARLSAEDYRYPPMASAGSRIWGYDGDPLDRGVYKRELGGSNAGYRRSSVVRSRSTPSAGRSSSPAKARRSARRSDGGRVIEILARTPRYVIDAVKSLYQSDNAPVFGIALFTFIIGLASLMDLMRGAKRA